MSAFSPRQMFLLDEACKPIAEAFPDDGLYLVGTAATRTEYRDVDVRLVLSDKRFDKLQRVIGYMGVTFLSLSIGEYLAARTGLPIDFQLQRQTEANARHEGIRNPLGCRDLNHYRGDARPEG